MNTDRRKIYLNFAKNADIVTENETHLYSIQWDGHIKQTIIKNSEFIHLVNKTIENNFVYFGILPDNKKLFLRKKDLTVLNN